MQGGRGWAGLERPLRVLVWLGVALALILIYRNAEPVWTRLFNISLLFVFGGVVALLLNPLVDRVERLSLFAGRRVLAVLALALLLLAAVAVAVALVVPALVDQATAFGQAAPGLLRQAQDSINGAQGAVDRTGLGFHLELPTGLDSLTGTAVTSAVQVLAGALGAAINVLLVVVISIYLLVQGRQLVAAARQLFPERAEAFDFAVLAVGSTIAAYVRGQLAMALLMGTYTGVAMSLIGVRYAVVLGVAAFFLEFLPLVGAPVAMGLAVLVAVFQGPLPALLAAAAGLGGHAIEAYILGPRIAGHATRLHPLAAMAALLIGADLGGVLGALFAVPLAGIVNVFLGAMYRRSRGQEVFAMAAEGELPRLGDEISQAAAEAEAEATAGTPSPPEPAVARPRRRRRAPSDGA